VRTEEAPLPPGPATIVALSRSAGNRSVARMLTTRTLQRNGRDGGTAAPPAPDAGSADAGAPTREQRLTTFRDHVANGRWEPAVLEANGWSRDDVAREMAAPGVSHHARVAMYRQTLISMFDWPDTVRQVIAETDPAAAPEGRRAFFHYARTQAQWPRIAIALDGFADDAVILELVGWLLPQELTALRDAAVAGGSARVRDIVVRQQKLAAFRDHVANSRWEPAVLEANSWSRGDIEREMAAPAVSRDARIAMYRQTLISMFDWPDTVRQVIASTDAAAAVEGRRAFFHYARTQAQWHRIAVALDGFADDAIIVDLVGWLLPQELAPLRDAALLAGSPARVVTPVRDRIRLAVADTMSAMQGQSAAWMPSGGAAARPPGVAPNTFAAWAEAASESAAPPIASATTINCWEMVLLAAYRSRAITWQWIHDAYVAAPPGSWGAELERRLTPGGRTPYDRVGRNPRPRRGDIVYFNDTAHVALATGAVGASGSDEVYTFWPPPDVVPYGRGTVDQVKTSTIELLAAFIERRWGRCVVETGAPAW
jgi:hypothetical protein